jgi:putative transposase
LLDSVSNGLSEEEPPEVSDHLSPNLRREIAETAPSPVWSTEEGSVHAVADQSALAIQEMEVDRDHVHLLVNSPPQLSPVQIVRWLKQESTRAIWRDHPRLHWKFWKKRTFWSGAHFCCSLGNACIETIRHYIETQG